MRLLLTLPLILLAGSAPALASNPECMGGDGESWRSIDIIAPMAPGECPAAVEIPAALGAIRYELVGVPATFPGKTLCSWNWVPGSGGTMGPRYTSIICSLIH